MSGIRSNLGTQAKALMEPGDRERKRAWKAQQRELAQAAFPVSSELLQALFETVGARVEANGCDHTLKFTRQWIAEEKQPTDEIIRWLAQHGGFCDCEVTANAFDHWEHHR